MNKPLRIAKQFYRDIDIVLGYIGEIAGPDVVSRFASAVESTRSHIRHFPSSGSLHYSEAASIDNLRMVPVTKFREYLVFYIHGPEEVVLVRLIHGEREVDVELYALDVK